MTQEQIERLKILASETRARVTAMLDLAEDLEADAEEADAELPPPDTRPVITVGSVTVKRGFDAVIPIYLTCAVPIAGYWLNLRHSPRLRFISAKSLLAETRWQKHAAITEGTDHTRHLVSFTTDAETGSATPGQGLVSIAPDTKIMEIKYAVGIDVAPGADPGYPIDGGISGYARLPTLLQNWGQGKDAGIYPRVDRGYVAVTA